MPFSIIMPCDKDRLPLLKNTLEEYKKIVQDLEIEFVFVSRTLLLRDVEEFFHGTNIKKKVISYGHNGTYFNPSRALNIGVINSSFDDVIITCPEVKPITHIFKQFSELPRGNYVVQVFDLKEDGSVGISLVNNKFRGENVGMYFLALLKKEDILAINGWDESYMIGLGFEDNDFGVRFARKFPHEIREEIQAYHQWHPRTEWNEGWAINANYFSELEKRPTYCVHGIDRYIKMNWLGELVQKEITSEDSVLDLGCGILQSTKGLKCKKHVGVEIYAPYVTHLKDHLNLEVIEEDVLHLKLESGSFDIILALDLVEHLEKKDAIRLIEMMKIWAKKKAIIYTPERFFDNHSATHHVFYKNFGMNEKLFHRCLFNIDELTGLGFEAKNIEPDNFIYAILRK